MEASFRFGSDSKTDANSPRTNFADHALAHVSQNLPRMSHGESEDPQLLRRRAGELALAGRHAEAAQLYAAALSSAPSGAELAFRLGEERRKSGDLAGARAAFERAAELFDADGRLGLADATRRTVAWLRSRRGRPRPR